jgi:type I restriction enzyme S subunit
MTGILTFDACFPDSIVGFIPGPMATTEYVMYAIRLLQYQLEALTPQAAQKNINLQVLRTLQIPFPDLNAQQTFSKHVDHIRQFFINSQESKRDLDWFFDSLQMASFSGDLTAVWRESHRRELEVAANTRAAALGRVPGEATVSELLPVKRARLSQPDRDWLLNQLSKGQGTVWEALQMWPGTLIHAEEIDEFRLQCFSNGSLDNTNAYVLRALDQLAGLGLVVKVSVPNQQSEYVTGYRSLREDELSHVADGQSLAES